jgi:hypothetical protein
MGAGADSVEPSTRDRASHVSWLKLNGYPIVPMSYKRIFDQIIGAGNEQGRAGRHIIPPMIRGTTVESNTIDEEKFRSYAGGAMNESSSQASRIGVLASGRRSSSQWFLTPPAFPVEKIPLRQHTAHRLGDSHSGTSRAGLGGESQARGADTGDGRVEIAGPAPAATTRTKSPR